MSETNGSEATAGNGKHPAFSPGMNASSQCCLVLNDPNRGYERLRRETKGHYPYNPRLTKNALNAQYRRVFPSAELDEEGKQKYPAIGAGSWIKIVRNAGEAEADRWLGVGLWSRVFTCFGLTLTTEDIEWKPGNYTDVTCFDSLDKDEVRLTALNAKDRVRIVSTYIPNWDFLRSSLTQALSRGATVQILLLDPDSPQAKYRADALEMTPAKMQDEIRSSLRILSDFYHNLPINTPTPVRFEARTFDSAPVASLYWFDDIAYMGPHWMRKHSLQSPQFRIRKDKNSALFASVETHFDALWQQSVSKRAIPE